MALKRKIDKAAFEKLSPELQKEYKKNGSSDDYILDTDGDDAALQAARTALENERQESARLKRENEAAKAEADARKAQEDQDKQRAAGDFKAIEEGYKTKVAKLEGDIATLKTTHAGELDNALLGGAAKSLAAKISNTPALVEPIIRNRLSRDATGEVRVLGLDGKVSALSVDDLGKELASNKEYSHVMIANRGSGGGGAPPGQGGKGGALGPRVPTPSADGKAPNLSAMTPKQLAAHMANAKAAQAAETADT